VIDQGPGVPDEYKLRLFERFAQISGQKGRRPGMGLGLTFCRLVAEAHGGRIWIEDNPTGGSVFAFILPAANNLEKP
jgi:signal transduction histidine kinase